MQNNARVTAFQDKLKKQTEQRLSRNNKRKFVGFGENQRLLKVVLLLISDKHIYVLDWDDGCEPTWRQNHEMTDRITLWNPEECKW